SFLSVFFFFFSSRRRHTRFSRDWSSDVCSSDLSRVMATRIAPEWRGGRMGDVDIFRAELTGAASALNAAVTELLMQAADLRAEEIGRASGRGSGEMAGGAVAGKKKQDGGVRRED